MYRIEALQCVECQLLTGISNGLHFVHIKVIHDGIKTGVEVVEQVHHLQWSAGPSNTGEAYNVTVVGEKSACK